MRRFAWNAARARKHCQNRRSLVNPNDGFWRSLCAFEQVLGITDRYLWPHGAFMPALCTVTCKACVLHAILSLADGCPKETCALNEPCT